ncbi:hypothetical protein MJG53_013405 [Ovis ammon polii x Ovis aries]|uniref:Uncharacterized protein n=1 Tax=Ovis ammon polii x Ovis aries TaxID=2918886 RepID=A0ACB9UIU5_9CETA|nr:hypothetical protein MJG53_013405 [Ovis ammon polii x Ovis aries]
MQAPESVMSLTRRSAPPNRQRQERTVYSKEQLEVLKEAFLKNQYPSYQDRLRLAARLHLDEHRVQSSCLSINLFLYRLPVAALPPELPPQSVL